MNSLDTAWREILIDIVNTVRNNGWSNIDRDITALKQALVERLGKSENTLNDRGLSYDPYEQDIYEEGRSQALSEVRELLMGREK